MDHYQSGAPGTGLQGNLDGGGDVVTDADHDRRIKVNRLDG